VGWAIASWDRASARGTVRSELGELPFDAAVAMTDDFRVGEDVEVSLRRDGTSYEITKVAPITWRAPVSPRAREDLASVLAEIEEIVRDAAMIVVGIEGSTRLYEVGEPYAARAGARIALDECSLVQSPAMIEDVAHVRAFDAAELHATAPELVRHWPAPVAGELVFRIEPAFFGRPAAYVVARRARRDV
jgi:hypothetical protein